MDLAWRLANAFKSDVHCPRCSPAIWWYVLSLTFAFIHPPRGLGGLVWRWGRQLRMTFQLPSNKKRFLEIIARIESPNIILRIVDMHAASGSLLLALHLFSILVFSYKPKRWVVVSALACTWLFAFLLTIAGPIWIQVPESSFCTPFFLASLNPFLDKFALTFCHSNDRRFCWSVVLDLSW